MNYQISNEYISITVSDLGAELQSIVKEGQEYLWNGDAKYWPERSPLLFPFVGRFTNGKYLLDGKEYEIIRVPFQKPTKLWVRFPDDYGCGNSPFSVEDINSGAVAWMYGKSGDQVLCIQGGEYLSDFKEKIEIV